MPRRTPAYAPVIRYLRRESGLTATQLGQRLGVADYYVGYLENGYRWPRPQMLLSLAAVFSWHPFELALLADVEIPYPDWPALDNLDGWRQLARDWTAITDAVTRYALARELFMHPDWQAALDPALPGDAEAFGLVACYGWIRRQWTPFEPHPARLESPTGPDSIREAIQAGAAGAPVVVEPAFLTGLSPQARAAVEAVAERLRSPAT
jgi:transcriptional regulator with XRE-family HTH domain